METELKILFISDDELAFNRISLLIEKAFPNTEIVFFDDGSRAISEIKKISLPTTVICDNALEGITGHKLISLIRSFPNGDLINVIYISRNQDRDDNLQALKYGADRIMVYPYKIDELMGIFRSSKKYLDSRIENIALSEKNSVLRDRLKKVSQKMKEMLIKFQSTRIPNSIILIPRIKSAALWIAKKMDMDDPQQLKDLEIACELCYSGKLFEDEKVIREPVSVNGFAKNDVMAQIPVKAKEIVESIRGYKESSKILYHQYENFDGSGFPESLMSKQIPLGSRILRVVMEFEEQMLRSTSTAKVIEELENESKRVYDHFVVTLLDQWLAFSNRSGKKERIVEMEELSSGMIITRNLIVQSGLKILGAGTTVNDETISKIFQMTTSDPIIGDIYIKDY